MPEILKALSVLVTQGLVYAALPWIALRRYSLADGAGGRLALCMAAGCSLQAILGIAWGSLARRPMGVGVALLYAAAWLVVWWIGRLRTRSKELADVTAEGGAWLALILLAGVALRLIHPLQHAALGQSDAYGHLQFLHDILATGSLRNPVYPPGYHWILALPTWLLPVDGYTVARYGGAFFGAGLILALYAVVRAAGGPRAGLLAAWFVALFPGSSLLIKTGIGCFANQLGLFLLPMLLVLLPLVLRRPDRTLVALFGLLVVGLAATVPMMLSDFGLLLAASAGIAAVAASRSDWKRWLVPLGAAAIGFGGVALFALTRAPHHIKATARTLTHWRSSPDGDAVTSVLLYLLRDYASVKRWLLQPWPLAAAWFVVVALLIVVLAMGWRRRCFATTLVAAWGLLAAAQTGFGVFQFSAYQRAGWWLLITAGAGSGIVADAVLRQRPFARLPAWSWVSGLALLSLITVARPPGPTALLSPCEDELVAFLREVDRRANGDASTIGRQNDLSIHPGDRIHLVIRRFTGFANFQGDLAHALVRKSPSVRIHSLSIDDPLPTDIDLGWTYLLVTESYASRARVVQAPVFQAVDAAQVGDFLSARKHRLALNEQIDEWGQGLTARADVEWWGYVAPPDVNVVLLRRQ